MSGKRSRGKTSDHVRFISVWLVVVIAFVFLMTQTGCDCDDDDPPTQSKQTSTMTQSTGDGPNVTGPGSVASGGKVELSIRATGPTVTWRPAPGAANIDFSQANPQPEPGGPPYVFNNVDPNAAIHVSYDAPAVASGGSPTTLTDVFQNEGGIDHGRSSALQTRVTPAGSPIVSQPAGQLELEPPFTPVGPQQIDAWRVFQWIDVNSITLTTQLCQDWLSFLQSDKFFIATRMPVSTTAAGQSYELPVIFQESNSPILELLQYGLGGTLMTTTLEYRADGFAFAENYLPAAQGEHWVAFGISSTQPTTCPVGLNVPGGSWGFFSDVLLDMSDQPNNCEGCTLQTYYCYKGSKSPLETAVQQTVARALADGLGGDVEAISYQGEGVTCLGPKLRHLGTDGGLHMGWTYMAYITPTKQISLSEHVENESFSPVTVTVDYTSSLGSEWHIYGGDWDTPDLDDPIYRTTQIAIDGKDMACLWFFTDVPADTPSGMHSLYITATAVAPSTLSAWDVIPLWAGEWVAPPPPGGGDKYWVYLPVVLKE